MATMSFMDLFNIMTTVFMFITGVAGNVFIAVIIIRRKRMRTVTNWFVLNLAICDLVICLYVLPMNEVIPKVSWPFGADACKYITPIMEHFAGVCVLTHTCLSIARYIVIRNSMNGQIITLNHVRIAILAIWVIPFLTMSATLMGFLGEATLRNGKCGVFFYSDGHRIGYRVLVFSLTYVIPMMATGLSYYKINNMVSRSMKEMRGHMSEDVLTKRRCQSRRMNRILMTMYIAFGVTTLPIQFVFIARDAKKIIPLPVFMICVLIFYAQVVTNPLVLFYMGEEYRKEIYKLPVCVCAPELRRKMSIYEGFSRISSRVRSRRKSSSATKSFHDKTSNASAAHKKLSTNIVEKIDFGKEILFNYNGLNTHAIAEDEDDTVTSPVNNSSQFNDADNLKIIQNGSDKHDAMDIDGKLDNGQPRFNRTIEVDSNGDISDGKHEEAIIDSSERLNSQPRFSGTASIDSTDDISEDSSATYHRPSSEELIVMPPRYSEQENDDIDLNEKNNSNNKLFVCDDVNKGEEMFENRISIPGKMPSASPLNHIPNGHIITSTPKNGGVSSIKLRQRQIKYDDVDVDVDSDSMNDTLTGIEQKRQPLKTLPNKQLTLSAYYDDGTLMYFYDSIVGRVSLSSDDGRETDL